MTDMAVKEKAAGEAAKQNDTVQILNDSDPIDKAVAESHLRDELKGLDLISVSLRKKGIGAEIWIETN